MPHYNKTYTINDVKHKLIPQSTECLQVFAPPSIDQFRSLISKELPLTWLSRSSLKGKPTADARDSVECV